MGEPRKGTGMLVASLRNAADGRRARARRALETWDALRDRTTPYAQEIAALARAHDLAAEVYERALTAALGAGE